MATTYSVDGKSFGSLGEAEDYLSGQGYDKYTIEDRRQGGIGRQTGVGMGEGAGFLAGAGGGGETFMGYGYTDPRTGEWVPASRDMVDGGGPGRSGNTFQGGPFSGILNALGVRPAGYRERQEAMRAVRPQARPEGLAGMAAALAAAKKQASPVEDASAAQSFSGMPYQIGITPQPYTPPTYGSNIGTAEILPLFGSSSPMTYQPVPGVSSSYLPERGFSAYYQPPKNLWPDPKWSADNQPSVYGPDAGYPSDVRPYMGLAPDYDYSPLHVYDDSRLSQPRRGFGDFMADIYGPIFGR